MEQKKKIFDWIDEILRKNDFKIVDEKEKIDSYIKDMINGEECPCALYESEGRCVQYVLVLDVGKANITKFDFVIRQRILYQSLQELGDRLRPEFDKNVSFLLCVEGTISDEEVEKEVLKIEENPYCFKKLVLTYTQEELRNVEKSAEKENLWDFMNQKVEALRNGKTNLDKESGFILKLLIKMPFLSMDMVEEQRKKNLMEEIEKNLEDKDKVIWEDIKEMELTEVEEIKNYTEEELDSFLGIWYTEERKE